jgi:nitric oxide reductase NorD protein
MSVDPRAARLRLCADLPDIEAVFALALGKAERLLSQDGVEAWLSGAERLCRANLGGSPVVAFLEALPDVAVIAGETVIPGAVDTALYLFEVPGVADCVEAFLATLPAVARRLEAAASIDHWYRLVRRMAQLARPGLAPLLHHVPTLLEAVTIGGLSRWIEFCISTYREQPQHVRLFFDLQTADSLAALQRQRHGTLLVDRQRELGLTLRSFWGLEDTIHPYAQVGERGRNARPHLDKLGFHLPDVLDDGAVPAIDQFRAILAHLAAHRLWSRPYTADNFSQLQHLAIEVFEDSRVEALLMARHPGLRRLFLALHPAPCRDAVPQGWSSIRHRCAMLSRAILDPGHSYDDPVLLDFVGRFRAAMAADPRDTDLSSRLGVAFLAAMRSPDFREPRIWFADTVVPYRCDNRFLWRFLEDTDSPDDFHSDHGTEPPPDDFELMLLVHYPEWDYLARDYRPDWTTLYQAIPTPGDFAVIDRLLDRHALVARQLKRVIDRLKPQNRKRIRGRSEGDDLDLDRAVMALVDLKAGTEPDLRVYQSHVPDERDIAVLLLLDLSDSIGKTPPGAETSLLLLSQEATTLLAWAVEQLGDAFAVAGFSTKSRHQIRYLHIKRFSEPWGPVTKGRLAALEAGLATRMGAALRHAGADLAARREDKKLLLLLSDGEPADIDVDDDDYLKWDTHSAVGELKAKGIVTYCMTLDPKADAYVADVFGENGYAVVDRVAGLPEKLTRLFLTLTK